jgi:hypothetical protein
VGVPLPVVSALYSTVDSSETCAQKPHTAQQPQAPGHSRNAPRQAHLVVQRDGAPRAQPAARHVLQPVLDHLRRKRSPQHAQGRNACAAQCGRTLR